MVEQNATLLVVDDNEMNRDVLQRRLERQGYAVETAVNGREAMEFLQREPSGVDLMLLDLMMPEMHGYELLKQVKADEVMRHIPVIMITAVDDIDSVVRCIEMGAEDYLPKPFDPVLLQARIGACLEKKFLRDREVSHLRQIEEQRRRSDALLRIILPHDVAEELKATQAVKPRRFDN